MKNRILSLLIAAVLILGILALSGCNANQYAMTVKGEKTEPARTGYYAFYVRWQRDYYKELLKGFQYDINTCLDYNYTDTETVRESIVSSAKTQYLSFVVITQKFEELGLSLSDETMAEINMQYDEEWIGVYGEAGMKNILKTLGLDREQFLNLLCVQAKSDAILDYYYGENGQMPITEQDKKDYYNNNHLRFRYVLLSTVDEEDKPLPSTEIERKSSLAAKICDDLKAGKITMEEAIEQYSEDYTKITDKMTADEKAAAEQNNTKAKTEGMITNLDGIFNKILYKNYNLSVHKDIIAALQAIEVNDFTVVTIDNSIWVVEKKDINEEESYYTSRKDSIYQEMYSSDFNSKYTRWLAELDYVFNDAVLTELDPGNLTDLFSEVYNLEDGPAPNTSK